VERFDTKGLKIDRKNIYLEGLRETLNTYAFISEDSWSKLESICTFREVKKGETLLYLGDISHELYFICEGLLRTYFTDEEGKIYNKNLFLENNFAASKVALLLNAPSEFCIEALEDTTVIVIPYTAYRELIEKRNDFKDFYIAYLEKNWVIEKEKLEVSLVLEDGTQRYLNYLEKYPNIEKRIHQHHIAAHLGITPTQLSRIRKKLKSTYVNDKY
jgi:CRP-like cAMP-binding protein